MKRGAPGAADPPTLDEIKANVEKRLFIGRLPAGASDEEVREVYGAFGALKECRVLPEKGVAFVGYDTWAAAHKALLTTDNQACLRSCNGQPISVSFAERSGSRGGQYSKGLEHSRIFVGGLPESCTDNDLKTLFDVFGKVEAANLLAPKGNRRCGFVNFSLWGEALDAIELLDGQKYPGGYGDDRRGSGGEAMTVVLASPREGYGGSKARRYDAYGGELALATIDEGPAADPEFESLKVAYLAAVDGDTPASICEELHRKIMARRPATRQMLAIAPSLAQNALLGGGDGGLPLLAAGCEERDAARLFVGGLPYECTDEELRALVDQVQFSLPAVQCQLLECRVLPGRGCGYVRFASWDAAAEAIQALNERAVSGWLTPLRVRWATPKGQAPAGAALGAVAQPQEKLLQLALQQAVNGVRADSLLSSLTALLGGTDVGAAAAQIAASNASVAQLTAAATAGSLGGMGGAGVGLQDEALIAAQGLDPKRLFIGQLSRELSDKAALTRLFEPFGQIESLRWLEDKGVAYVQYAEFAAANAAITTLGGKHIPGISRDQGLNINFSRLR